MSDRDRDRVLNFIAMLRLLHARNGNQNSDDDDDDEISNLLSDRMTILNENHLDDEEKEEIETSFFENRKLKTPKKIEKPKPHEYTEEEITRMSEEEDRLTNTIRQYISNKKLLFEVLSELNGVDPKDPIFKEFY